MITFYKNLSICGYFKQARRNYLFAFRLHLHSVLEELVSKDRKATLYPKIISIYFKIDSSVITKSSSENILNPIGKFG